MHKISKNDIVRRKSGLCGLSIIIYFLNLVSFVINLNFEYVCDSSDTKKFV